MPSITIDHTTINFSNQRITPKYIVWHDTGVRDQSDEGNASYFRSVYREASANYFIDENSITEVVAPGYVAWHCGDGNGAYGITNQNSIGIELCPEADGNFKPETIANALWLGKKLMSDWGISYDNNVRHYDASRKNCPQYLNTDGRWTKWYAFKAQLKTPTVAAAPVQVAPAPKPKPASKWVAESGTFTPSFAINVRSAPNTSGAIVATYSKGQSVRYDSYYNDGRYVWIHYKSYSGHDRYMVCRENGTAWGSFS